MRRLKQVYTSEKERESAELEECKRLSFENSVLCQRIKTLEDETCHLADKLIKVTSQREIDMRRALSTKCNESLV